jgi:hypothetical protein
LAASKTISLTDAQHRKALWRLLQHDDLRIRAAAEHAVRSVVHEDEKARSWTDRELQQQVVWVLASGASLLANEMANIKYVVPACMDGFKELSQDQRAAGRLTGKVTIGAVKAAVVALSRRGPGRRKGAPAGDRATLIAKVFTQLGIEVASSAAVSKLLERHAKIDLSVIWTKTR